MLFFRKCNLSKSGTHELQTWWFSTGATGSASFDEVKFDDDLQK